MTGGITPPPLNLTSNPIATSDGQFRSGDVFFGTDAISAASQLATGTLTGPQLAQSRFVRSDPANLSKLALVAGAALIGVLLWKRR